MKFPIYDTDNPTRLVGYTVDGQIVQLSPIPTDDAYDDLWDESCQAFERHPQAAKRTDGCLRPNPDRQTHSSWLGDEVAVWIQQGDLRDPQQVNAAIAEYADHFDRLVRLGAIQSWSFSLYAVKLLRWFFGVAGSQPLPTKQQVLAAQAESERRQVEYQRSEAIRKREDKALEAEVDTKIRIKKLIQSLAEKYHPCPDCDFTGDNTPPEFHEWQADMDGFKSAFRAVIDQLVRENNDKTDDELIALFEEQQREPAWGIKMFAKRELPEPIGERHMFDTEDAANEFISTVDDPTRECVKRLGLDGRWAVDVETMSPERLAEAQLAEERLAAKKKEGTNVE